MRRPRWDQRCLAAMRSETVGEMEVEMEMEVAVEVEMEVEVGHWSEMAR